jgi:predicted nucleic acid-binding protein
MTDLLGRVAGQLVYIDTNCFIYLLEDHPVFGDKSQRLFAALEGGVFRAVTSVLTLTEIMTGPFKLGENELAAEYARLLETFPGLQLQNIDRSIARQAAMFRSTGIRAPDALHLATAVQRGASVFVTSDKRLIRVQGVTVALL